MNNFFLITTVYKIRAPRRVIIVYDYLVFGDRPRDFFQDFAGRHTKAHVKTGDIVSIHVVQQLFRLSHEHRTRFAVIHVVRSNQVVDELLYGEGVLSEFLKKNNNYNNIVTNDSTSGWFCTRTTIK